jgi:phosphate-selective porin OprO/OprP
MKALPLVFSCLPFFVYADGANEALLKTLLENGAISAAQYETLSEVGSEKNESDAFGGLKLKTPNGNSVHIGGRVEAHFAAYQDDQRDMGDGAILRRARFYIKGKVDGNWLYKLDYDLVDGGMKGLKDAYIGYRRGDGVELYAGNYRVPFSLEFQANPHANTFMERALPFAFAPGWRVGAAARIPGENWLLEGGVFGDRPAKANSAADGEAVGALRLTGRPIRSGEDFLHVGAAVLYGTLGDQPQLRYRSGPESRTSSVNLVDTGAINGASDYFQSGFEASITANRFNAQAEYIALDIHREPSDLQFSGWYLNSSVFLTNDRRRYKSGRYIPVKPNQPIGRGGAGAWELAARLSSIDLSDGDIDGGKLKEATLALNVYATQHVRFSGEYIHVLSGDDRPAVAQLRAEWVF